MAATILDDPYAYVARQIIANSNWSDSTSTSGVIISWSPTAVASNRPYHWDVVFAPYGNRFAVLPIRSAEDFIRRQKSKGRHPLNLQPKPVDQRVVQLTCKTVKIVSRKPRRTEAGQNRKMYVQKLARK